MTVYALKPRFQNLLLPVMAPLPRAGVTANIVTVVATLGSVLVGAVTWFAQEPRVFLIIPAWLIIRMALNAIDGMMARQFHQESTLGVYLNELGDVISDAALYAPFALVPPFGPTGIAAVIILSMMTEIAGALGPAVGASRRYDGPLGKSDRAVVFGALGLWMGLSAALPPWVEWVVPLLVLTLGATIANRVRAGVAEITR